MSDKNVDREVFEVHMKNLYKRLDEQSSLTTKLFQKQDEMNTVLTKNTVVVNQHHQRSTNLESVVEKVVETLEKISVRLGLVESELKTVESELKPIKVHVSSVSKIVAFLFGLPAVVKFVGATFTTILAGYGLYKAGFEAYIMLLK